jgi:hypothetical protein
MVTKLFVFASVVFVCGTAQAIVFVGSDFTGITERPNHDTALAQFNSASGASGFYGFEGAPDGAINANVTFAFGITGKVSSNSGAGVTNSEVTSGNDYGTFAFSGAKQFLVLGDPGVTLLTITFDQPMLAFGASISDMADWGSAIPPTHQFVFNNGETYSVLPAGSASLGQSSAVFWGMTTTTAFTSVTLRYPTDGFGSGLGSDGIGIDNIRVAAVPEPASVIALLAGLAALRRRRSQ